jgi:hypothetical protein
MPLSSKYSKQHNDGISLINNYDFTDIDLDKTENVVKPVVKPIMKPVKNITEKKVIKILNKCLNSLVPTKKMLKCHENETKNHTFISVGYETYSDIIKMIMHHRYIKDDILYINNIPFVMCSLPEGIVVDIDNRKISCHYIVSYMMNRKVCINNNTIVPTLTTENNKVFVLYKW